MSNDNETTIVETTIVETPIEETPVETPETEQKSKPKKVKSKAKRTKKEAKPEEKKVKPKAKPKAIVCKYVKRDKYKNTIMLVSKDSDDLCEGYLKAKSLYKKLRGKFSTNLPFWLEKKKEFATIRFKKSALTSKLKDLAIYEIQFTMNQTSNKDGDKFVNLNVVEVKLISEHDPGKQLDISSEDDEDLETSEDSDDDDESE
jgi:hypothetical protein